MRELVRKAFAAVRLHWQDMVVVVALAAMSVVVRLSTLRPLDIGGDPAKKWFFVRTWGYQNHWERWDHQMARMGINFPTWVVQKVFGTEAVHYYIPQVTAVTLTCVVAYLVGRRLGGRFVGVLAACMIALFDQFEHAGSQLNPEAFEVLYEVTSVYCLLRYADAKDRARVVWLIATGTMLFLLYLTKEPNVFFYPGFALAVWMISRRFRDVLILAAVPAVLFMVETAFYRAFTDYHWGRLQIVTSSYGKTGRLKPIKFWGLFRRYTSGMDSSWKLAIYPFFLVWPALFLRRMDRAARLLVPVTFSFLLGVTFYVRGINPIVMGTVFHQRYLSAIIPTMMLTLALCVKAAAAWVFEHLPKVMQSARLVLARAHMALTLMVVVTIATFMWVQRNPLKSSGIATTAKQWALFNRAYAAGVPIVAKRIRPYEKKIMILIHGILLSDKNLLEKGHVLRQDTGEDVSIRGSTYFYLHKKGRVDDLIRKAVSGDECMILVSARGYTLTVETNSKRIERCLADAERRQK